LKNSSLLTNQLKNLRQQFNERTEQVKNYIRNTVDAYEDVGSDVETASNVNSTNQNKFKARLHELINKSNEQQLNAVKNKSSKRLKSFLNPIKEQDLAYLLWLAVVSFFYLYNLISISFRYAFVNDSEINSNSKFIINHSSPYWLILDYVADIIYLVDMLSIKIRVKYLENGLFVTDKKLMFLNYIKSKTFFVSIVWLICF
jgi:hypothetical protein